MTDIRELLTEAGADIEVGSDDAVARIRRGLARRRRTQAAVLAVVAATATAIAVPVSLAGPNRAVVSTGPTHVWANIHVFEVVDDRHPAQHTRFARIGKDRIEIRRAESIQLAATSAAVRHGPSGWQIWVAAPGSATLYQRVSEANPPSFIGLLLGQAYRLEPVQEGHYYDVVLLPFPSKKLALVAAERTAPLVSVPESVRVTQCVPRITHCARWARRARRMYERQQQADHARRGH